MEGQLKFLEKRQAELIRLAYSDVSHLNLQRQTCIAILGLYRRGILRKDILQWLVAQVRPESLFQ